MMQGYYSQKMANIAGTVIYSTPDGGEIECSAVGETAESIKWDDLVCLGPVTRFVRTGRRGRWSHHFERIT